MTSPERRVTLRIHGGSEGLQVAGQAFLVLDLSMSLRLAALG